MLLTRKARVRYQCENGPRDEGIFARTAITDTIETQRLIPWEH